MKTRFTEMPMRGFGLIGVGSDAVHFRAPSWSNSLYLCQDDDLGPIRMARIMSAIMVTNISFN